LCVTAMAFLILRLLNAARAVDRPASADFPAPAASQQAGGQAIPCQDDDDAMASWIWKNLEPRSGESSSVQGELLRAVAKLRREAVHNGNINWDERYESLVDFLYEHLIEQSALAEETKAEVLLDLGRLRHFITPDQLVEDRSLDALLPCVDEYVYERLTSAVVEFSRLNPVIIERPFHAHSTS
jgi:hypothetical protein